MKSLYHFACAILYGLEKGFHGIEWVFSWLSWQCHLGYNSCAKKIQNGGMKNLPKFCPKLS